MTDATKLILLKDMTGEVDGDTLQAYLDLAGQIVLNKCYPFDKTVTTVPACYDSNHVEIAAYLLNKRGAEGEQRHTENGIDRAYEAASVPASMLKLIVPFAKGLGGA